MSSPTLVTHRIEALDLIRGFALCGLVLINGIDFGFGSMVLVYPLDFSEGDSALWAMVMGLGCGKFATLFSALFGAGMLLFCERVESSGRSAASVYLPRLGWLLLFGMLHAYLLWHGDILVTYAMTGFVLFWCRNWPTKVFALIGGVLMALFLIPTVLVAIACHFIDFSQLSEGAQEIMDSIRTEDEKETAALTGSWVEQMKVRALYAFVVQLLGIPLYLFWFAAMNMCFGMALMKSGFFTGGWSVRRVRRMTAVLLSVGLPLTLGGYAIFAFASPAPAPLFWAYAALLAGMPLVAFGYAGLGVLWSGSGAPGFLRNGLAAVGRMAFSNYIAQSIILGLIYYGHGLGLRGQLQFHEALLIVPLVWLVQMLVSVWWLKRFRFGPLEWLWRRLTYGAVGIRKAPLPPSLPGSR
ncbi:MAG: DUF418 domain-containing protein [Verrucomicrobiota bacterium]